MRSLTITALPGVPLIQPGDNLAQIILDALEQAGVMLEKGSALVITSKIVSKAEGRVVSLDTITAGAEAERIAAQTGKDPRLVELILRESSAVSRVGRQVIITRHRLGFVLANAGIDHSNIDGERVLLLPLDPDASARAIRQHISAATGVEIGIVISDSHGRPFRLGTTGVAIGVAGMPALLDLRGQADMFGRILQVSMQSYADLVASAANLVMGEGAEGLPVALVQGLDFPPLDGRAADLNRPPEDDLY
jgi:coenzyme F420-0:L-glutamate ligase/coenzyme F420-1:gamma-L-glutamate ligase